MRIQPVYQLRVNHRFDRAARAGQPRVRLRRSVRWALCAATKHRFGRKQLTADSTFEDMRLVQFECYCGAVTVHVRR